MRFSEVGSKRLLLAVVGCCVGAAVPTAGADISISMTEPLVQEGETMAHQSSILKIRGEVYASQEIQEVTINGRPAGVGSRDLVVEAMDDDFGDLAEEGTPFQGAVQLAAGDNEVRIVARAADGSQAEYRFVVSVDAAALAGTAYALIIGINDYSDDRISDLRYAEPDAEAVRAALTHPEYGIVRPENVQVLKSGQATYREISMALEEQLVRKATKPEDVVFFYFAGHGAEGPHVSRGAAYYLVPHDADLRNLMSTAIDKGRLQFLWGAVGAARKVFITDACHSGGLQDMRVLTADGFEAVEGFITLAAAKADQRSWELPDLGHGIFTYALSQGLQGAADQQGGNGDGFVSATELGSYLNTHVAKMAAQIGADQAPIVDLVPGADQVLIATSAGKPLPEWSPSGLPPPVAPGGPIKVLMRFKEQDAKPKVVIAVRDEGGDRNLGEVATTAIMNRFMEVSDVFRFVEPGAIAATLDAEDAALAFSEAAGDLAAVARAVEADLLLTATLKSEASGAAAAELLGTAVQSYQAHVNARVVYANTGEVMKAAIVQKPGMHLNADMARRQAIEKTGIELADQIMGPVLERWSELRRERPSGLMTVSGVTDLDALEKIEDGIAAFAPAVRELAWVSFGDGKAIYEFATSSEPKAVGELLAQRGLAGLRVGKPKSTKTRLSFSVLE